MSKGFRLVAAVLGAFLGITVLHVWLNVGFENFSLRDAAGEESRFRVGFLPVT